MGLLRDGAEIGNLILLRDCPELGNREVHDSILMTTMAAQKFGEVIVESLSRKKNLPIHAQNMERASQIFGMV